MNAIWYPIHRWDEAKRFYGELLGLKETHRSDEAGWAAYACAGGPPLFLVRKPERAGQAGGAVVTFETENVGGMADRLKAAGIRVEEGPSSPAVRLLSVYDPDGNLVEISSAVNQ